MDFEEILNAEKQKYTNDETDGTKHLAGLDGASAYKQFMKSLVSTNSEAEARAKSKLSNPKWKPIPKDTFFPLMPWGIGKSGTEIGPEATTVREILPLPLEPEEYGSQIARRRYRRAMMRQEDESEKKTKKRKRNTTGTRKEINRKRTKKD